MDTLNSFFSSELSQALGWTLLHALWQGALLTLALAGLLSLLKRQPAKVRYCLSNAALWALLAASVATFSMVYTAPANSATAALPGSEMPSIAWPEVLGTAKVSGLDSLGQRLAPYLPHIVLGWCLGLAFFLLRLLGGLAYAQRLRHSQVRPLPASWQNRLSGLARRLGLRRRVALLESPLVATPMTLGWLKPVILFPLGAINGLSTEEAEAVLAHELAHIYRWDYLLNLLQSLIETLYYFNPAVWWISARIRLEREHCCDDLALRLCGGPLAYAKALVAVEAHSHAKPALAMAFAQGGKGQLLQRIARILGQGQNTSNTMEKVTTVALLVLAALFLSFRADVAAEAPPLTTPKAEAFVAAPWYSAHTLDSLPVPKSRIQKEADGRRIDAYLENGEVIELSLDGKAVPKEEFGQHQALIDELRAEIPPPPPAPSNAPSAPAPPSLPAPPAPPSEPKLKRMTVERGEDGQVIIRMESEEMREENTFSFPDEAVMREGFRLSMDSLVRIEVDQMQDQRAWSREQYEELREQAERLREQAEEVRRNIMKGQAAPLDQEHRLYAFGKPSLSASIERQLLKDGFIESADNYRFELSGKGWLKIDGKKQPVGVFERYKQLYERTAGTKLEPKSNIAFKKRSN